MSMKREYKGVLFVLLLVFVIWLYYLNDIYAPLIDNASPSMIMPSGAQNIAQSIAAFAAVFASIIAVSSSDPSKPKINIGREISIRNGLTKPFLGLTFARAKPIDLFEGKIIDYHLKFKLTNNSQFTLIKPTMMIQAPNILYSDIFKPCELFRNYDHIIFEELPFWNSLDSITFCLGGYMGGDKILNMKIKIDINCENAEGITITERITLTK